MVEMDVLLLVVSFALLAGLLLLLANRTGGNHPQEVISALKNIQEDNHRILVRPSGEIAGLIPPNGEEKYHDDQYNMKRERIKYYDVEGEINAEPRDGVNKKLGKKVDLIPIEHQGGIALTEIMNPDGERKPIITGNQAQRIQQKYEDTEALKREVDRTQKEYRTKERNYQGLQEKLNNIKEERNQLENDIENFRTANERLNSENDSLKARAMAAEAKANQLQREMHAIGKRHEDLMDEIAGAIKSAGEIRQAKLVEAEAEGFVEEKEATEVEQNE